MKKNIFYVIAVAIISGLFVNSVSFARSKINRPIVVPAPGHLSSGYEKWNGQHGVCDVQVKVNGKTLKDNKYGNITEMPDGTFVLVTYDAKTYTCASAPKPAPVQDFEKPSLDTRPNRGALDPSTAAQ